MSNVEFTVPGIPIPQGSKNVWGGEDNPHTKSWRQAVAEHAHELRSGDGPLLGPVIVAVDFVFPRPKSHYRTGRFREYLRGDAPFWHTHAPDLDKLQRAIGDALTGVLIRDDSQIAAWQVRKFYGQAPGATIDVTRLTEEAYP